MVVLSVVLRLIFIDGEAEGCALARGSQADAELWQFNRQSLNEGVSRCRRLGFVGGWTPGIDEAVSFRRQRSDR